MPKQKIWTDKKKEELRKHLHMSNDAIALLMETSIQMIKKMKHKYGFRKSYQ